MALQRASTFVELATPYFATEYLATKPDALTDQSRAVSHVCVSIALLLLQGLGGATKKNCQKWRTPQGKGAKPLQEPHNFVTISARSQDTYLGR